MPERAALTRREIEILKLLADDLSSKEIGQKLGISSKTVEFHRTHMRKKLGVSGLIGLVRYAIRAGIIEP